MLIIFIPQKKKFVFHSIFHDLTKHTNSIPPSFYLFCPSHFFRSYFHLFILLTKYDLNILKLNASVFYPYALNPTVSIQIVAKIFKKKKKFIWNYYKIAFQISSCPWNHVPPPPNKKINTKKRKQNLIL